MSQLTNYAANRWAEHRDVPNDQVLKTDIADALNFGRDRTKELDTEVWTTTRKNLSIGLSKVADLQELHQYLDDPQVHPEGFELLGGGPAVQEAA